MSQEIQYTIPEVPLLLTTASFLYLVNVADATFAFLINAGLLGPLAIGIIYGSEVSDILPAFFQESLILLGYIGLLLLVFEAGLDTDIGLLYKNVYLSVTVAFTGITLPIGFSMLLLALGYKYSPLQAFGAGVSLSSTSLGTTLSLLPPKMKMTRTGTVLLSAALIDDIIGLVLAAIIPQLPREHATSQTTTVKWSSIVRPIDVSIAFGLGTPVLAQGLKYVVACAPDLLRRKLYIGSVQLFLIISILCGYVAGAKYAGTSELWGAYLAGALLSFVFPERNDADFPQDSPNHPEHKSGSLTLSATFALHIRPILEHLLSPIFFASIGFSLPIRSLFLVNGSRRVIWRGILYSISMIVAKALTGLWILSWPNSDLGREWFGRRQTSGRQGPNGDEHPGNNRQLGESLPVSVEHVDIPAEMDKSMDAHTVTSAMFVGFAMVARGEIALIVAQLARPLLDSGDGDDRIGDEPFAVVIWAIIVTTVFGALAVGTVLRRWDKKMKD